MDIELCWPKKVDYRYTIGKAVKMVRACIVHG